MCIFPRSWKGAHGNAFMRENKYTALILKKQPLGEADEIITFFTKEAGKLRALAKASKAATSKLQYSLQPLFLCKIILAGNHTLPKVIESVVLNSFRNLRANPKLLSAWYVVAELLLKATADAQKNAPLFQLCQDYLTYLDANDISANQLSVSLTKFKIHFLANLGLNIHSPKIPEGEKQLFFSSVRGGFYYGLVSADAVAVSAETWADYKKLCDANFSEVPKLALNSEAIIKLVNSFLVYQLERELKSEKFFST